MKLLFKVYVQRPVGDVFSIYAYGASVVVDRDPRSIRFGDVIDDGHRKAVRALDRAAKTFGSGLRFVPATFQKVEVPAEAMR